MTREIMLSAVIHIVWCIWIERNNRCFQDKILPIVEVKCSYSFSTSASHSSVTDYQVSHLRVPRPIITSEVRWIPPREVTIYKN